MSDISWPAWHCPQHKKLLSEQDDRLCCTEGHAFLRINHIPRFVSGSLYADAFGEQWKRYRLTQLDSYTSTTISKDRLYRCLGEPLRTSLKDRHVLECGCGAGRFTELLLELGASVTSVDLSDAVEANLKNCPLSSKHRIAQADIAALPFAAQKFDLVLCLGVVQHTPSPEKTLTCLYDQVKPGGALVIDHYTWNLSWCTKASPLIRPFVKRMRPENGIRFTEMIVKVFYPLHLATRRFRLGQMLLSRISPVQFYGHAFPELSESLLKEWALLDTHDSLTDWYKHFRTKSQILRALTSLGLERIWCEYGGNGIEARGYRPARV